MSSQYDYDLVIIGGGMVGLSLAATFADTALSVAVIEPSLPQQTKQPSFDQRSIALSISSQRFFETLGMWPKFQKCIQSVSKLHISREGGFGHAQLDAYDYGLKAFGHIVGAQDLGQILSEYLSDKNNIQVLRPASFKSIRLSEDQIDIELNQKLQTISSRVFVAADGTFSNVKSQLGIKSDIQDYNQAMVVANVSFSEPNPEMAFERFRESGALALLPIDTQSYCILMTVSEKSVQSITKLNDADFCQQIYHQFGYRLGCVTNISKRVSYPIKQVLARSLVKNNCVLVGNAAHQLHPIAAQGLNLSIRDLALLAEKLCDYFDGKSGNELEAVLKQYQEKRRLGLDNTANFIHSITNLFEVKSDSIKHGIHAGLIGIDILPKLGMSWIKEGAGLKDCQSKLLRGIRLGA